MYSKNEIMFWKRKLKVKANVLADTILAEFVDKPISSAIEQMHIKADAPEVVAALNAKLRLYQFASVLLAVLNEEQKNKSYSPVRELLERNFFPPSFSQGANMLDEVKCAMRDLDELFTPSDKPRPLSWACKWLSTVGVDESNPVTLHLFTLHWLDHFIAINKSLQRFKPET